MREGSDEEAAALRVALAGDAGEHGAWARAFRSIEHTSVTALADASEHVLLEALTGDSIDAVAMVAPYPDLPGAVRRALMARKHVFIAGAAALTSRQLNGIDELARRRNRVVLFDAGLPGDGRLAFVQRMMKGPQAIWRPRYLRALTTGRQAARSLDDIAVDALAAVLAIAGQLPAGISGRTPRIDDESGAADAASVSLDFRSVMTATLDLSLLEPLQRREITIACAGRTVVLDALDARAPLQIHATSTHRGPRGAGAWSETIIESPTAPEQDPAVRAAETFASAVRAGDAARTNAGTIAEAALVWETARASMTAGGENLSLPGAQSHIGRPALRIIEGGGHRSGGPAPHLVLLGESRRSAPGR